MNYHIQPRTIWLTRHGETEDNVKYAQLTAFNNISIPGTKHFANITGEYWEVMRR
jgi:hypothetical protein